MFAQIWVLLLWLLERLGIWRTRYRGRHVTDLPDKLKRGIVYVVGDGGHDWSAVMLCPGGCGKTLEMNLLPDVRPVWQTTEHHDRTISLHPSVWLKTGCGCHFVLHKGRVRWA